MYFIFKGNYYVKDLIISAIQLPLMPDLLFTTLTKAYIFGPHRIKLSEINVSGSIQNRRGYARRRIG